MMAFTPKREDGRPAWRVIYDEIARRLDENQLSVGDLLSHSELRNLLTSDELRAYYTVVNRVSLELRERRARMLRAARSEGYRLIAGTAQVEFGQQKRRQGAKQIKRALDIVQSRDAAMMSDADRSWADRVENGMVTLVGIAAMHEEKLAAINKDLKALKSSQTGSKLQQVATNEEVAELKRRIEQLENKTL